MSRLARVLPLLILVGGVMCHKSAPVPLGHASAHGGLRVALLLPGAHDDGGWCQAGYESLGVLERELGAETAYAENLSERDFEPALRRFADQGYDFVIGLGTQFAAAAERVAASHPRVSFAIVGSYSGNNENLGALDWRVAELGYLAGAAAALESHNHHIGYVGGQPYANMHESVDGYIRGAHAIDPSVQVDVAWVGDWTSADRAAALARDMIRRGADVVLGNCNLASDAIFEAAREAHVYAIGWSRDQYALAPGTILTSGVLDIPELLRYGAKLVAEGRWEGKHYRLGIREGVERLAPFHGLLSPAQAQTIDTLRDEVVSDAVVVRAPTAGTPAGRSSQRRGNGLQ